MKPWQIVDSIDTDEGLLDLRQRGETDFLITIDNRVLMNSSANMSEMEKHLIGINAVNGPPRLSHL